MKRFLALLASLFIPLQLTHAADSCPENASEILKTHIASGSLIDNLLNRDESVRAESTRMLESSLKIVAQEGWKASRCPKDCRLAKEPELEMISSPNLFEIEASDAAYCTKLEEETQAAPLLFDRFRFKDREAYREWLADLSQGKGREGKILYKKCDRSCSPRYSTKIKQESDESIEATVQVVCGAPRDRDDNQFILTAKAHWSCISVKPPAPAKKKTKPKKKK